MRSNLFSAFASLTAISCVMAASPVMAQAQQIEFAIQPMPLGAALKLYAIQSGDQMLVPADLAATVSSQGATGRLSREQALGNILKGTGLEAVRSDMGVVSLRKAAAPPNRPAPPAQAPLQTQSVTEEPREVFQDVIVVTAERRGTLLSATPAAMTVMGGEEVDALNINSVEDFMSVVPGLNLDSNERGDARMAMRGIITAEDSAGTDHAVAYFIDGIYYGRSALVGQSMFDVERVEVLRGPQGTLWGRNVVGGAINVITTDPGNELESEFGVTMGNYDRIEIGGRVAGPLVEDKLFGSVAFSSENADGWLRNNVTGNKLNGDDRQSARAKLKGMVGDTGDIEFSALYQRDRSPGIGRSHVVGESPLADLPDFRDQETVQATDGRFNSEMYGLTLESNWKVLGGDYTFSTLTGYINFSGGARDFSFFPIPPELGRLVMSRDSIEKSFSQEVRLAYDANARLRWQTGLYYYNSKSGKNEFWDQHAEPGSAAADPFGIIDLQTNVDHRVKTESFAAFAQATYKVLEWLSLTGGARYTDETKKSVTTVTGDESPFFTDGPVFTGGGKASWDAFTPKVIVDAYFEDVGALDSLLLYATWSKGWKSGGFDPGTSPASAADAFRPEKATNYEAGLKTRFLSGRAFLEATYFHTKYKDLQIFNSDIEEFGTVNASGTIDGIELQGRFAVTPNFNLFFGYAYYDGVYDEGAVFGGEPVGGDPLIQTPKHSGLVGGDFDIPTGESSSFFGNVVYSLKGAVTIEPGGFGGLSPANNAFVSDLTKQSNLSARLGFRTGPWEFSVWGRNLTNDRFLLSGSPSGRHWLSPDSRDAFQGSFGAPRTYGASIKWAM